MLLGNVLLGEKHLDEALAAFSKAISLKPNDANAYLNRGATYAFLKQDDAAEQDFRKAISIDPHALQAYANLAGFYLYRKIPRRRKRFIVRKFRAIRTRRYLICAWLAY